jgi:hypothetical protein
VAEIEGYVDRIVPRAVQGWAVCPESESAPTVELFVNGQLAGSAVANLFRADVRDAGKHITGWCGFRIVLENQHRIPADAEIDIRVQGSDKSLNNCPLRFKLEKSGAALARKLYFMHVPKSGGTSVKHFLEGQYPRESALTDLENIAWQDSSLPHYYDLLAGHIEVIRLLKHMDLQQFKKFTVVRHPVDRLISHILWIRAVGANLSQQDIEASTSQRLPPLHRLSLKLCELDLSDHGTLDKLVTDLLDPNSWLNEGPCNARHFNNNGQIRFFLNVPNSAPLKRGHVRVALKTVELFDFVLINERLKDGLRQMAAALQWTDVPSRPARLNVMRKTFGLDRSDDRTRSILSRAVEIDLEFYATLNERFA